MDLLNWAKREVEIACKKENPDRKDGEFDYGCACYESALKAIESLCEDGHSGMSIRFTKDILNRLIDRQPLTPIEDTDDIWDERVIPSDFPTKDYQCKRMSSLFKKVYADGHIEYSDVDRSYCVNINDHGDTYTNGLSRKIINEMFPITMPYMPGKPIAVFCEEFLTDTKNGDFDTVGMFYALKTENGEQKRYEINRFFREPEDDKPGKWLEISKEEYDELKARKINKEDA